MSRCRQGLSYQFAEDGNAALKIFFKNFILAPEKIPVPV